MARVIFEGVSKHFGDVTAIEDLSLHVADREFLVLVGPSGCGKSTFLRLLAGLDEVSAGSITIGDRQVNGVPPRDRNVAMVFQSYALYPHMTVFDNMAFSLKVRRRDRAEIERRVLEAARMLDIEDMLDRRPRQLSGGQRQRVALGRAVVREPSAFLLDEPLSNLDARLRVQTRAELTRLHTRLGTTFIYVTHDQVEAMTMAGRIAVMDRGRLQQVGTPRQLYEQPGNLFVAGFIGSPSMNLLEATVTGDGDSLRLRVGSLSLRVPASRMETLVNHREQEIVFGIRPEDLHLSDPQRPGSETSPVRMRVDTCELTGSELQLSLRCGPTKLLACTDPRRSVRPGEDVEIHVDMSAMHSFDRLSGRALPL